MKPRHLTISTATLCLASVLGAEFGANNSGAWGPATNNLQMSITHKRTAGSPHTNPPVVLTLRIRNLSTNATVRFWKENAPEKSRDFFFLVTAPSGRRVSPEPPYSYHGSGNLVEIPPGQTEGFDVDLSTFCNFDEPGAYTITASHLRASNPRAEGGPRKPFRVFSNTISVQGDPP